MADDLSDTPMAEEEEEEETKPSLEVSSVTLLSQNPLSCNMCGKVFQSRRELLVHQWSHKERQAFFCPNCEKNFNNENQFKRHMQVHTREGKKYVTCDICKKVFRNNRVLEEHHVKDHSGQKPYRCGTCGIQFSWRENLKKHLHTHIEKPFACTICHESFRDEESLDVHGRIHKREMKELEKREQERREQEERDRRRELHKQMGVFAVTSQQQTEVIVKEEEIDDEDRLQCKVCNQSFRYAFTLEAHMKGHIEDGVDIKKEGAAKEEPEPTTNVSKISANPMFDKPFICEICDQTFRWAFCLDAHLKIHRQGYDAKVEKEKERRALKLAKERRRLLALQKAQMQPKEEKQEGTVVIVVEPLTEEEKREAAAKEAAKLNKRAAANNKRTNGNEPKNESKPEPPRKRTRREMMAEQLTLEGRQPDEVNETIDVTFGDFETMEFGNMGSDNRNVDSEEDGNGVDIKPPRLPPTVNAPPVQGRTRGGAKTRGGARVRNHIDLNDVVASIEKESRENLVRMQGGIVTGGRGSSHRFASRQFVHPPVKIEEEEEEEEQDGENEEEEAQEEGEAQEEQGESECEPDDGQEESMDEGSEGSSAYDDEEGEADGEGEGDQEEESDEDDGESEHMEENPEVDDQANHENVEEQEDEDAESRDSEEGEEEEASGDEQEASGDGQEASGDEQEASEDEQEGSEGEQDGQGDEQDASEEEKASSEPEDGEILGYDQQEDDSGEEQSGEEEGEEEEAEQESEADEKEIKQEEDDEEEESEAEEEIKQEEDEDEAPGDDDVEESGSEQVDEAGEQDEGESVDGNDDDDDNESHTSTQVNEAAQTMMGLDTSDDEYDEEDEDNVIQDDVDKQELMKLKMKVYSCELCSKAFVQADQLMEHKVNYHQQNGEAVRNILVTKTPKVSPHSKVVSGPRSHSGSHRKSR